MSIPTGSPVGHEPCKSASAPPRARRQFPSGAACLTAGPGTVCGGPGAPATRGCAARRAVLANPALSSRELDASEWRTRRSVIIPRAAAGCGTSRTNFVRPRRPAPALYATVDAIAPEAPGDLMSGLRLDATNFASALGDWRRTASLAFPDRIESELAEN